MFNRVIRCTLQYVVFYVGLTAFLGPLCASGSLAASGPKNEQSDPKHPLQMNRDGAILEKLRSRWKELFWGQVNTAEFTVEYFRIQDGKDRHISMERMRTFLAQVKVLWQSSSQPTPIRELSASLPIPRESFPNSWLSGKIIIRGKEVRNSFKADLLAGALPDAYDTSFAGGVDVFYVADSRQASLFETESRWQRFGLTHMCYPPPLAPDVTIIKTTPEVVQLRTGDWDFEIDRLSTGVNWARISQGNSTKEYWQCGFAQYTGGNDTKMLLPSLSASIEYVDGYVTNCFMFVKKSVRFNHQLDDGAFRVPVPAGTNNVVLFPGSVQKDPVGAMMAIENVDDIAGMLPRIRNAISSNDHPPPSVSERPPRSSIRFWLMVTAGVLLFFLGLGVYFRSRLKRAA